MDSIIEDMNIRGCQVDGCCDLRKKISINLLFRIIMSHN
jgi:hypothetical protein